MDSTEKSSSFFSRKSPQIEFHDYSGGDYFITICTRDKEHYFGKIINGEMEFTELGRYCQQQIASISVHYPYAEPILYMWLCPITFTQSYASQQTHCLIHAPLAGIGRTSRASLQFGQHYLLLLEDSNVRSRCLLEETILISGGRNDITTISFAEQTTATKSPAI